MANRVPRFDLHHQGIDTPATLCTGISARRSWSSRRCARGEGMLAKDGPLVVETGKHTGRSAKDKFIVRDAETEGTSGGTITSRSAPDHFAALKADFLAALGEKDTLFVQDLYGGSQPEHRVRVRVINELAWHNLFIRTMLVRPPAASWKASSPNIRSSTCRASRPIRPATARAARR